MSIASSSHPRMLISTSGNTSMSDNSFWSSIFLSLNYMDCAHQRPAPKWKSWNGFICALHIPLNRSAVLSIIWHTIWTCPPHLLIIQSHSKTDQIFQMKLLSIWGQLLDGCIDCSHIVIIAIWIYLCRLKRSCVYALDSQNLQRNLNWWMISCLTSPRMLSLDENKRKWY